MSVALADLVIYLNRSLAITAFDDYAPNGLQVEGRATVTKLASGVTASQALVDAAIEWGADAILVHHGYFWRNEDPCVVGMKRRRLGALLGADISLLGYHLPLDAHPQWGNNARLADLLGLPAEGRELLPASAGAVVGNVVSLPAPICAGEFVARLEALTGRMPLHVGDPAAEVGRIAWCTGGAQGYIEAALAAGADLYLTGEVSEQTVHVAREEGIQFVAAGHHATERYGAQAVGEHVAEKFSLQHRFIDIDNPA
ncbi:MAG: Nif3-like dinuclear metal center hexameric protein [Halioglobus sp.]|nr:Nif3-like dinuclear metal center hexameric protein [Halioglobus sp.]